MVTGAIQPDIHEMIAGKEYDSLESMLLEMEIHDLGAVVGELEGEDLRLVIGMLLPRRAAEVLAYLPPNKQEEVLGLLQEPTAAMLVDQMRPDERTALLEALPQPLAQRLIGALPPDHQRTAKTLLAYPPESVGRLMTTELVRLNPAWTVQQGLDYIRQVGASQETLHVLYVVDAGGHLLDDLHLEELVLANPRKSVRDLMDSQVPHLGAQDDREAAVVAFRTYDAVSLPVVDEENLLVGMVTVDDVLDVQAEEVTEDIQKQAGMEELDQPYLEIPLWSLFRKRGLWLTVLFLGEMLTASAMGYFESEISRAVVLALFIPLIISSGGNSGSQASTLVIRAMALEEVRLRDWKRVLRRELAMGLLLGLMLGGIGVIRVNVWQWLGWMDYTAHYELVAVSVGTALVGVILWGSLAGSMLPFLLRKLGLDPAAISAPFIATLVDVSGLVIYFTTAWLILRGTLL